MTAPSIEPRLLAELLTHSLELAKGMLAKAGEFYPFAAAIQPGGALVAAGGDAREAAGAREISEVLRGAMRAEFREGKIVAAAIAANVNIPAEYAPQFPDGIRVHLECDGYARFVYLPYRIERRAFRELVTRSGRRCEYGKLFSVEIAPLLCAAQPTRAS